MMNPRLQYFLKYYHPFLAGAVVLAFYAITIAPSVIQIDSGELAAVQLTLGIAHPTGYPLFTILGFIFSHLPIPVAPVAKMNILAALWVTGGVIVFIYTSELILKHLSSFVSDKSEKESLKQKKSKKNKKEKEEPAASEVKKSGLKHKPSLYIFTATSAGLILAFNKTVWFQSTSVEVYSLHILLILLIIHLLIRARLNALSEYPHDVHWFAFAFMLALGFTNHMTTLLILPGVAYIYFITYKLNKESSIRILKMLFIFFTTLFLVYSYLPIRGLQNPSLNWGNPVNLENIIRHISGKQYQVWIFSSTEAARKQFEYFISQIPLEFTLNLVFVAIGLVYSFLKARKMFIFLLISFVSTVLYAINYDIVDIDSYFLLAYISMAYFALFGLYKAYQWLGDKQLQLVLPASLVAIFLAAQIYLNYEKINQKDNLSVKDYTTHALLTADKHAIIFTYQWDFFISASYYFQYVEKMRTDVKVIDKELLRRSWYFPQLDSFMPDIMAKIKPERETFLRLLAPFEKDLPFDPQPLETAYRNLMLRLIETNLGQRPVYIGSELVEGELKRGELIMPEGVILIPDLFFYRVTKGNKYIPASDLPEEPIRFPAYKTYYTNFIYQNAAAMLTRRIFYELQFNKMEKAKAYYNYLRTNYPEYTPPAGLTETMEKSP
ncbi:MAG: DUF2723 domain-containing protein [Ignavibacteriales bacterium]|nr:MAG: DUF2723 domain-containing protein [Ignavibacteriales bacterium]